MLYFLTDKLSSKATVSHAKSGSIFWCYTDKQRDWHCTFHLKILSNCSSHDGLCEHGRLSYAQGPIPQLKTENYINIYSMWRTLPSAHFSYQVTGEAAQEKRPKETINRQVSKEAVWFSASCTFLWFECYHLTWRLSSFLRFQTRLQSKELKTQLVSDAILSARWLSSHKTTHDSGHGNQSWAKQQ